MPPTPRAPDHPPGRALGPAARAPVLLLVLAVGALGGTPAARAEDLTQRMSALDAPALVRLAATRDAALRRAHAVLRYDEEVSVERLDAAGAVLSRSFARRSGVPLDGGPGMAGVLAANGGGGEVRPASAAGREPAAASGSFAAVVDLAKLAGRFELTREADAPAADGRPCFVVTFRPRMAPQTYDSREEMVINQLTGRFWFAREDLAIVQSEGTLTRPVKVAWVASVYRLSFAYRTQTLTGTEGGGPTTVPASFVLDLGVKAPLYHARQRQTTKMTAFRPGDVPGRSTPSP